MIAFMNRRLVPYQKPRKLGLLAKEIVRPPRLPLTITAADPASQGWSGFAGPALFVAGIRQSTALYFLPLWLAGPVVVLALFGFLARGQAAAVYALLWLIELAAMIALFARPENWYWATLGLPLTLAGLAFVPRGFADLVSALRGRGETSMESA